MNGITGIVTAAINTRIMTAITKIMTVTNIGPGGVGSRTATIIVVIHIHRRRHTPTAISVVTNTFRKMAKG